MIRPLLRRGRQQIRQIRHDARDRWHWWSVARQIGRVAPIRRDQRDVTLFFVPYSGVRPLMAIACVIARALKERGHEVLVTRCFELFDRCPVMNMYALPYDASGTAKRDVCLRCADNSLRMLEAYGLDVLDLRRLAVPEMTHDIDDIVRRAPANVLDVEVDGIPFGAFAAADVCLTRKLHDVAAFTEADRQAWRQYLRSSLFSYRLMDRACKELSIRRVVHVNDYSLLMGARVAARKNGIPCYSVTSPTHRNVDLRRYVIMPTVFFDGGKGLIQSWRDCRDLALTPHRVREIADDLMVRFSAAGVHIYSPPKTAGKETPELRAQLGISAERRLIVAFTSSVDEAAWIELGAKGLRLEERHEPQPFRTQLDWLQQLVARVEHSPDLQLVVRIHPREAANKRDSIHSQHLAQLREAFGGSYQHCKFVWPQDPISSYDLGEMADMVLTWGSSVGLEFARLGVPVLAAVNSWIFFSVVDEFLEWAATPTDYFKKLHALLERPATVERIVKAFRWYNLLVLGPSVDISDVVPHPGFDDLPDYRTPREAACIEEAIIGGREVKNINISRLRAAQHSQSESLESGELRRQLRRFIHVIMTGMEPTVEDAFVGTGECGAPSVAGSIARYTTHGQTFVRYSPMVARLVPVCLEETDADRQSARSVVESQS
jgi:hypothetical protein